jgi:hypothetical protein
MLVCDRLALLSIRNGGGVCESPSKASRRPNISITLLEPTRVTPVSQTASAATVLSSMWSFANTCLHLLEGVFIT